MNYIISNGETSSGIILNSNESMAVLDGGVASTTTVNQYGSMTVFSGGTAIETTVDRGQFTVSSGGTAGITAVNSRGIAIVSSGGTANDTTMSGGTLGVLEGGCASNVSVQAGGALYVDSDGSLTGLIALEKGAHVIPLNSGWKLDFDVSGVAPGPDAQPRVSDLSLIPAWNGIDFGITISGTQENGVYILAKGATGFDFTLAAACADDAAFSGVISLQSGFVYGESVYLLSVADGTLCLTVSDVKDIVDNVRPTVSNVQVSTTEQTYDPVVVTADFKDDLAVRSRLYKLGKDGEWLDYADGAVVTENTTVYLKAVDAAGNESEEASCEVANILPLPDGAVVGFVVSSRNLVVSAGEFYLQTLVSGIVYDDDEPAAVHVDIVSGGTMVETSLQMGILHISSGGVASKTEFVSRCGLTVSSGGTAADTNLTSGGSMRVDFGGVANNLRIISSGAECMISSGGTAAGVDVRDRGILEILRGGTATDVSATPEHREDGRIVFGGILRIHVDSGTYAAGKVDGTGFEIRDGVASGCLVDSGHLTIYSGCKAVDTTVAAAGVLQGCYIESGAAAERTVVTARGRLTVSSGGTATDVVGESGSYLELVVASNTYVNGTSNGSAFEIMDGQLSNYTIGGGYLTVYSGCTATDIHVDIGNTLEVLSGGTATAVSAGSGGKLELTVAPDTYFEGSSNGSAIEIRDGRLSGYAIEYGGVRVLSGGVIENTAIYGLHFGMCRISGGKAINTTVNAGGQFSIASGVAENTTVEAGGNFAVTYKGVASNTVFKGDPVVSLGSGGKLTGQTTFAEETMSHVYVFSGAIVDFNIAEVAPEAAARINNLSLIPGLPVYTLTVSDTQAAGTYTLAERAAAFDSVITIQNTSDGSFGTLAVGETVRVGDADYTLNLTDGLLSVEVAPGSRPATKAVPYTLVLKSAEETGQACVMEYSTDGFAHKFRFTIDSDRLSLFRLAEGSNAWRTMLESSTLWTTRSIENMTDAAPKLVTAEADGNADVFFAYAVGIWEAGYAAKHVGSIGDGRWDGTNEQVTLTGKNRIADVIKASTDSNILLMTDDENGDALFVDDIYTDLPGSIEEQQSRIAQIDEIRAGAGNDIVDMTSQRFEYVGDGLTIRGGEGNDIIWANKGNNKLFGDAGNDRIVGASGNDVIVGGIGNDRMHGGGGNDIFTFCENWGSDNVEQLASGTVTLWFASGDESNWNAETLTYTDGENSVKVSGVTADKVTLKFGDDGSAQFASLADMGAFFDATTEHIFEESGKGILASL
jgi:autotransporter passenger strand-loop-strand repeat protein